MLYLRMIWVAVRLAWPDLLAPWRSPLLRWRMETYGFLGPGGELLHAEDITPAHFLRFTRLNCQPLLRFLRWAADL